MTKFFYRVVIIVITAWLFPAGTFAQTPVKQGLFWRITGNGLSRPSYLLGTVHLKDKRLFNLPDSVYEAIAGTEGMAMELDPSTISDLIVKEPENNKKLKAAISPELFKKVSKKLETVFGKKPEEVSCEELKAYCNSMLLNFDPKNNMSSILDLYLYGIASRQGKWTGGIEDKEDQSYILNDVKPESYVDMLLSADKKLKSTLDSMVNLYLTGNIDLLMDAKTSSQSEIATMTRRNHKMARRMDSLSAIRSMFFAVGAAHLGGKEGVVELLRLKGFTVEPVKFTRRIHALDHPYSKRIRSWKTIAGPDSLYTVRMPGNAEASHVPEMNMRMLRYIDTLNGAGYLTMTSNLGPKKSDKEMADMVAENFGSIVINFKKINRFSIEGIEVNAENKKDKLKLRIQFFLFQEHFFTALIVYKESIETTEAFLQEYFDGFEINTQKLKAARAASFEQQNFADSIQGFSVWMPQKPRKKDAEETETSVFRQYEVNEVNTHTYFYALSETLKKGYSRREDNDKFTTYINQMKADKNTTVVDSAFESFQGYPAMALLYKLRNGSDTLNGVLINILKGNRTYFFAGLRSDIDDSGKELLVRFGQSIKLLPLPKIKWTDQQSSGIGKVWTSVPFEKFVDTSGSLSKEQVRYLAYDSTAPVTVEIMRTAYKQFYRAASDTAQLRMEAMVNVGDRESVRSYELRKQGPFNAVDMQVDIENTHLLKRLVLMNYGDSLVVLYASADSATLNSAQYDKMFRTYLPGEQALPSTLFKNKTTEMIAALQSTDSTVWEDAKQALRMVAFTGEDLPALHSALKYDYSKNHPDENIISMLCSAIEKINHPSSPKAMEEVYLHLSEGNDEDRAVILNSLVSFKTDESYAKVVKLLRSKYPHNASAYYLIRSFCDSVPLAAKHYAELLPLLKDTVAAPVVMRIVNTLLSEKAIGMADVLPFKSDVYAFSSSAALKDDDEALNYWANVQTIRLLNKLNGAESIQYLRRFLKNPSPDTKLLAITALVPLNQTVPADDLLKVAEVRRLRLTLYDTLASLKKLALFPRMYYVQKAISASEQHMIAIDNEMEPDEMEFIGERVLVYKKEKKKFLLFKMIRKSEDGNSFMLGVSGPYPLTPGVVIRGGDSSALDLGNTFNAATVDVLLKELLKKMENEK